MLGVRSIHRLGWLGVLAGLWAIVPIIVGLLVVTYLGPLSIWLAAHKPASLVGWGVASVLLTGLGVLPVYANNVLTGWVFGWKAGLALLACANLLAMALGYGVARAVGNKRAVELFSENNLAQQVQHVLLRHQPRSGLIVLSLWRLSGFPFSLTNLFAAASGAPLGMFSLATVIGLLPRVLVAVLVADFGARTGAHDLQDLLRRSEQPRVMILALVFFLFMSGLMSLVGKRALKQYLHTQESPEKASTGSDPT